MTESRPPPLPAGGFLSRWSRRKDAVRQGVPVADPAPAVPAANSLKPAGPPVQHAFADPNHDDLASEPASPLSLLDVQALSAESDFIPFMARGVSSDVRNAAMKKLFADPHYNVMDGLDIYIDDYSKTVPLAAAVVRRMVSAQFLGLFDEATPPTSQVVNEIAPAIKPGEAALLQPVADADADADDVSRARTDAQQLHPLACNPADAPDDADS